MSSATLIPLGEYLDRSFAPDCEYIDGALLERQVGKRKHSRMQMLIGAALHALERQAGVVVLPEQRVRITETRVRIPDLCVIRASDPDDQVVANAPVLCIEILSPDDSMSEMQERVEDYLQMGVETVWIVDPWRRKAYSVDGSGVRESPNGQLDSPHPHLSVDCSLLWM